MVNGQSERARFHSWRKYGVLLRPAGVGTCIPAARQAVVLPLSMIKLSNMADVISKLAACEWPLILLCVSLVGSIYDFTPPKTPLGPPYPIPSPLFLASMQCLFLPLVYSSINHMACQYQGSLRTWKAHHIITSTTSIGKPA